MVKNSEVHGVLIMTFLEMLTFLVLVIFHHLILILGPSFGIIVHSRKLEPPRDQENSSSYGKSQFIWTFNNSNFCR